LELTFFGTKTPGMGLFITGAIRDIGGLKDLDLYPVFFPKLSSISLTLNDPNGELNTTLVGINTPTRIGDAMVIAGDVVLGRDGGVYFYPTSFGRAGCKNIRNCPIA